MSCRKSDFATRNSVQFLPLSAIVLPRLYRRQLTAQNSDGARVSFGFRFSTVWKPKTKNDPHPDAKSVVFCKFQETYELTVIFLVYEVCREAILDPCLSTGLRTCDP